MSIARNVGSKLEQFYWFLLAHQNLAADLVEISNHGFGSLTLCKSEKSDHSQEFGRHVCCDTRSEQCFVPPPSTLSYDSHSPSLSNDSSILSTN